MTASIFPLHMILVAQILIYLLLPLMIDPAHINIPLYPRSAPDAIYVASELFLVILPPLLILQISFLLII